MPSNTEEKYTTDEVRRFLATAGLTNQSMIFAPRKGPAALGFEVRIGK